MLYTVLKPFQTPKRRFRAGQEVAVADIDGEMPPEQWAAKGFLKAPQPALAAESLSTDPTGDQEQPDGDAEAVTVRKGKRTAT